VTTIDFKIIPIIGLKGIAKNKTAKNKKKVRSMELFA
jgi:hypothetical protein